MRLAKLVTRQKRPASGDVFRVRVDETYYFGLVVDGNMAIGPMAPGSILSVMFAGNSDSGVLEDLDRLCERPLLMPPDILNQRAWTLGYAEKIGTTDCRPKLNYVFRDPGFGKFVDRYGKETTPDSSELIGVWALGNEYSLSDAIVEAIESRETQ
jgi:hypothetical protein